MRPNVAIITAAAASAAAAVLSGGSPALAQTFNNPIVRDSADPWVFQFKGQYFHTRAGFFGLPTVDRSTNIHTLGAPVRSDIIWSPPSGQPYSSGLWAPEVHYLDNKWYAYVAADDGNNANHRMYVLEGNSQDPQGTYEFRGKIAAATDRWAIDGTVAQIGATRYMIWSGWSGTTNVRQDLYIARMSSPTNITGNRVLISSPQYAWEQRTGGIVPQGINEAPQIIQRDGKTFLIYSASLFADQQYCLGQLELTGSDPMLAASWTKKSAPVFSRTADVAGPGHASFVKSPDGTQDWLVYHAHNNPAGFDERRNVHTQSFTWNADGSPNFDAPVSPSSAISVPGGRAVSTFIPNCGFDRADVRSSTSAGTANGVEQLGNRGVVGVVDNRGRFFTPIGNGDGAQCGFINAVGDNGVFYDVGQIYEAGTYNLSAGFAISSNQSALATAGPGTFRLVLESVGRDASGNPIESDKVTLSQLNVNSSAWNTSSFTFSNTSGAIPLAGSRLDSILRVGVYNASGNLVNWSAKLDKLNLTFTPTIGWQRNAGGNWSDQSNWSGGVPSGKGALAKFTSAVTAARTITLDASRTIGSIVFDNASRYTVNGNTLTLDTASGPASITLATGTHTISSALTFATDTNITVTPLNSTMWLTGTLNFTAGKSITKSGAGGVTLKHIRTGNLAINDGRVQIISNGTTLGTSSLNTLSIGATGKLNLTNNDLVIRTTPTGTWNGSAYTGVTGMVAAGYGDGTWNGNGILTTMSDATTGVLTTLAVARAGDVLDISGSATTSWSGQTVDASSTLVKYTWGGDADLNGELNGDDYFYIDSHILQSGSVFGFHNGDFNYDGEINGDDYFILDSNILFAQGSGMQMLTAIPEPGGFVLLLALCGSRRRKRQ